MNHHLTPAQVKWLGKLCEELGEAQQAIGKILFHGFESRNPGSETNNREDLEKELGDVGSITHILLELGELDFDKIARYEQLKSIKLWPEAIGEPYLDEEPT